MRQMRRRQRREKVGSSPIVLSSSTNSTHKHSKASQGGVIFTGVQTAVLVTIITAIIFGIYYVYKTLRSYRLAKDVEATFKLLYPYAPKVGQTVTGKIRFRHKESRRPVSSELFRDLQGNATILLLDEKGGRSEVAILKEPNMASNHLTVKFSLRKAGTYEICVKYQTFKLVPRRPCMLTISPGPPDYKNIDFGTHNSNVLCLTTELSRYFRISVNDEFGNPCKLDEVLLSEFDFKIFQMGNQYIPQECEFCLHVDTSSLVTESNSDRRSLDEKICLQLKVDDPGVYIAALSYKDFEVPYNQESPKLVVCITPSEEAELRAAFTRKAIPGTFLYTTVCEVLSAGDNKNDGQRSLVGVSYNSLCLGSNLLTLTLYPQCTFPVNGKTKLVFSWIHQMNSDTEAVSILIEDGLRPSLWIEVEPIMARILLVSFAYAQGFTLGEKRVNFQQKKKVLREKLAPYFPMVVWLNPEKVVDIRHGKLIVGSIAAVPKENADWLLRFSIRYNDASGAGLSVQAWLNALCDDFFCENCGFFHSFPGSKLLHPSSATKSRQPIEYYRFCGQILAKCIVETLVRGTCTRLSGIKFTKSFLAYMLGFPVNYKFLETDDPTYFQSIKHIIQLDLTDMNYAFTTLTKGSTDMDNINLLPNGSDLKVTNENKEHYLNLLAKHKLIHTVEQEIAAIRSGFYDVLDKDYFWEFSEVDLQMLVSGGCRFRIDDMKSHHRVVREVDNHHANPRRRSANQDINKLLDWLFVAVQNMSEKEQAYLVFFVTGSFSLPACGFQDLNPLFTISLTGTYNEVPRSRPISNELILGDHISFDHFERSLLYAIKPESERTALLQTRTENRMSLYKQQSIDALPVGGENGQEELEEGLSGTDLQRESTQSLPGVDNGPSVMQDPFVQWLRELVNL